MNSPYCPYCHSIQSVLMGNVYCSRHGQSMETLETGTLYIRAQHLEETAEHVSRLSIRCMLNGEQHYRVGNHDVLVTPENYLVVNQGQRYKTSFHGDQKLEMILVAFKPGFAEGLLNSLIKTEDQLLADPFHFSSQPVTFFEKTYEADPLLSKYFERLRKLMNGDRALAAAIDLDHLYTKMLTRLFFIHLGLKKEVDRLGAVKASTRLELYRRLHVARDYMDAHACEKLSLHTISKEACLSVHHFKRSFHSLFGISPHQYLLTKKIGKARQLLAQKELKTSDVCIATGFENVSSFIRLFRAHTGTTPGTFRSHLN